jgi:hypothetical protein
MHFTGLWQISHFIKQISLGLSLRRIVLPPTFSNSSFLFNCVGPELGGLPRFFMSFSFILSQFFIVCCFLIVHLTVSRLGQTCFTSTSCIAQSHDGVQKKFEKKEGILLGFKRLCKSFFLGYCCYIAGEASLIRKTTT